MIKTSLKHYYNSEFTDRDLMVEKFSILRHLNDVVLQEDGIYVRTPKSVSILKEAISYYLTYLSTQLEVDQIENEDGPKQEP